MSGNSLRCTGALAAVLLLAAAGKPAVTAIKDPAGPLFLLEGHTVEVSTVAFSPDGKRLASASNREVKLWDATTGKEVLTCPSRGTNVYGLAFSPDGQTLAFGVSRDVKLLEAATGKELLWIKNAPQFLFRMAFSPDGRRLAAAGGLSNDNPGAIHIWDPKTGKQVLALGGHAEAVLNVAFSADGKFLVSSSGGTMRTKPGQVRLWDAVTGQALRTLGGHAANVYGIAFSPDGRRVASAGGPRSGPGRGEVKVWEAATGQEVLRLAGHATTAYGVVFSPDGRLLASAGEDGKLAFWDAHSGDAVRSVAAHTGAIYSVCFSPDGKRVATAGRDRTIKVWTVGAPPGPRPGQAVPGPKEIEALWDELAGADAARAYRAIWALTAAPAQAVPFLSKRLRPAATLTSPQAQRVQQLVRDLDNRRFSVREKATRELAALGPPAVPLLRQALDGKPSAEARRRLEQLLEALSGTAFAPDVLQGLRAVEVLEHIATPQARRVLEAMAAGLPTAPVTQEARASLERLAKRSRLP
ncbi:MAG: PD40 domain-containing protein [Planctomycetes bacterium]|nr:PD40 domain-containing protein [Planctomycetota bacterium]